MVPSVFVPEGEQLATLLLGNLEHLINHKYQLFFYLKLLGIPSRAGTFISGEELRFTEKRSARPG
jgi:hypothetical protein